MTEVILLQAMRAGLRQIPRPTPPPAALRRAVAWEPSRASPR